MSVGRPFWHRVPPAAVGAGAGLALGILIFATAGATRPATMTAPRVEAPRAAVAPPLPPAPAPAVERDPSILNGVQREAPFVLDRYDRPEPVKAGPAGPAEAGSLKPTRARPGSRNRSIDPTRRRPAEGAATASASHSTASFGDVALMRDGDALEVRLVFEAAALEICHDDVVVEKWPYVKIRRAVYSTTSHKRWGGFAGQGTRHWATLEGPAGVLKMRLHKSNHAAVFAALRARGIGD